MEIVTIEKKTFELWKQRFESFVGRMDAFVCLCEESRTSGWITANLPPTECFLPDSTNPAMIRASCLTRKSTTKFIIRLPDVKPLYSTK